MKKQTKPISVIGKIFETLFLIICAAFVITAVATFAFGRQEVNGVSVGPYSMFSVMTGSMRPTIETGSLIVTKAVPAEDLKAGDILTYSPRNDEVLVTHRIMEVIRDEDGGYSYVTRGDANEVNDPAPVRYENATGRVVFWINGVGRALNYIATPKGIASIVSAIVLLIAAMYLVGRRNGKKGETNEK